MMKSQRAKYNKADVDLWKKYNNAFSRLKHRDLVQDIIIIFFSSSIKDQGPMFHQHILKKKQIARCHEKLIQF